MPASFSRDSSRTSTTSPGLTSIVPSASRNSSSGTWPSRLVADVDDGVVLADRDHGAADDLAFLDLVLLEALLEERGEVFFAVGVLDITICKLIS